MGFQDSHIHRVENNLSMNGNTLPDTLPVRSMSLIRGANEVFYVGLGKKTAVFVCVQESLQKGIKRITHVIIQ